MQMKWLSTYKIPNNLHKSYRTNKWDDQGHRMQHQYGKQVVFLYISNKQLEAEIKVKYWQ
jgi:hypothetical protein